MHDFFNGVAARVAEISQLDAKELASYLEVPPDAARGDIALPCFRLAAKLKRPPAQIAAELASNVGEMELFSRVEATGPYLNFFVNRQAFALAAMNAVKEFTATDVVDNIGEGKTVVIDFSSPNIAKPFTVGHLRSTVIGNALANIHEALGYRTVRINHLGDWGTQFGKLIVAWEKWGSESELSKDAVKHLFDLYVKFHDEAKSDASLEDAGRAAFKLLESGDEKAVASWRRFSEVSLEEFNRIYDRLGVRFDSYAGEAFYNDKIQDVVELLRQKGLLRESQGAQVVPLEEPNLPACLILKSDGTSIYQTRDLAAAIYRKKTYDFDLALYVVGSPQKIHFRQVFAVLRRAGFDWADRCIHVDFGQIRLKANVVGPEKDRFYSRPRAVSGTDADEMPRGSVTTKMSSRTGNVVFLEDVLERSVELARDIIKEKNPALENKEEVAEAVGVGAIVFSDLSSKRVKDIDFDWDEVLNFDGETGPYVQYACVRLSSILERFGREVPEAFDPAKLTTDEDLAVLKLLARFPETLARAAEEYEPSIITRYLLDLAGTFNYYYRRHHVLVDDDATRAARINLVAAARKVFKRGLAILGVPSPEKM